MDSNPDSTSQENTIKITLRSEDPNVEIDEIAMTDISWNVDHTWLRFLKGNEVHLHPMLYLIRVSTGKRFALYQQISLALQSLTDESIHATIERVEVIDAPQLNSTFRMKLTPEPHVIIRCASITDLDAVNQLPRASSVPVVIGIPDEAGLPDLDEE